MALVKTPAKKIVSALTRKQSSPPTTTATQPPLKFSTFAHYRIGKGRATAAMTVSQPTRDNKQYVDVAFSFWSPRSTALPSERFEREMGRTIAQGRLQSRDKYFVRMIIDADSPLKEEVWKAMLKLLTKQVPSRFKKSKVTDPVTLLPGWASREAKKVVAASKKVTKDSVSAHRLQR